MERKLGAKVVMKEPQFLYDRCLKSTQMEKVGVLFTQGLLPLCSSSDTPVEKWPFLFR